MIQPPANISKKRLAVITVYWWLVAFFPGAFVSMMTVMMFDAPGSGDNPLVVLLATMGVLIPVFAVVCPVLAWLALALSWRRGVRLLIRAPFLPPLGMLLALVALMLACNGSFACRF